jgi:hypothetical protein
MTATATATCGICHKKISHEEGVKVFNCKDEDEAIRLYCSKGHKGEDLK